MFLRYRSRWMIIAGILLTGGLGQAAEIKTLAVQNNKTMLSLTGGIVLGDKVNFLNAIAWAGSGRPIKAVQLNSLGGSVLEAVEIAGIVRKFNIATSVVNDETCASACFIIFAAGYPKFAAPRAMIGVHSAHHGTTGKEIAAATLAIGRYLRELGVSEAIVGKLVLARPNEMAWLTMDDLHAVGALTLRPDRPPDRGWPFCSSPLQIKCLREVDFDPFKEISDPAILNQLNTPNMFDQYDPPGKKRRGGKTYYQSDGHWYEGSP
jgi:ATP-dependent protease ClpP protease subunit